MISEKKKRLKLFYTDYEIVRHEQETARRRSTIEWRLVMVLLSILILLASFVTIAAGVALVRMLLVITEKETMDITKKEETKDSDARAREHLHKNGILATCQKLHMAFSGAAPDEYLSSRDMNADILALSIVKDNWFTGSSEHVNYDGAVYSLIEATLGEADWYKKRLPD